MRETPSYYTRLAPFRSLFTSGVPILTYHKFGSPPRHARLRGLFLPPALLQRQLRELGEAGFQFTAVSEVQRTADSRRVALTIDDGFRSVLDLALPILQAANAQATLYLVADRLGSTNDWEVAQGEMTADLMSTEEVREWLDAGQRIGSHSLTHPWLTRVPRALAREEIRASRARLEDLFGTQVEDFCYPYGDWNICIRDEVVEAGYKTATTTDFGVNPSSADSWALKRITARYSSWSWRRVRTWWRRLRHSHS